MDLSKIVTAVQEIEPEIATAIELLDPAAAATVATAESAIAATESLYTKLTALRDAKGAVPQDVWDAQVQAFVTGAAAVKAAEEGS
jgi:hypothetical protein